MIDKAMLVVAAVAEQPRSLNALVDTTGMSRATAHRLARALETHGMLRRDAEGRFALGSRLLELGGIAAAGWPLSSSAAGVLARLRDITGESVQLYVREGDRRVCVASLESPHGLRTIVARGAMLPLRQGSGGKALLGESIESGWVASVEEREPGVASVSAPVIDRHDRIVAAVSVSGPIERLTRDPGLLFGAAVADAATTVATDAGLR